MIDRRYVPLPIPNIEDSQHCCYFGCDVHLLDCSPRCCSQCTYPASARQSSRDHSTSPPREQNCCCRKSRNVFALGATEHLQWRTGPPLLGEIPYCWKETSSLLSSRQEVQFVGFRFSQKRQLSPDPTGKQRDAKHSFSASWLTLSVASIKTCCALESAVR